MLLVFQKPAGLCFSLNSVNFYYFSIPQRLVQLPGENLLDPELDLPKSYRLLIEITRSCEGGGAPFLVFFYFSKAGPITRRGSESDLPKIVE